MYLSEPFTRMQAWIDLLLLANHKKGFFYVRGNKIVIGRGQIGTSSRTLACRWQWSRGKVERFLKELEDSRQIKPQKNNVTTLISICNYEEYQSPEPQIEPLKSRRQTTDRPQTGLNKNDKNVKNDKNNIEGENSETAKQFTPPSIEDVQSFISEKEYSVNAKSFISFYTSKNWYIGENKMRDWKAAIVTWEERPNSDFKKDPHPFVAHNINKKKYGEY
ncbi:MAG: hypothetical protein RR293_07765 [Bacteroidales bacterium]